MTERLPSPRRPNARQCDSTYQTGQRCSDKRDHFSVLSEAERHFRGAVGQQRVPKEFLADLPIPLPPLEEQKRIAGILKAQMAAVDQARKAAQERLEAAQALLTVYVRESLTSSRTRKLKLIDCLEEIKDRVGEDWDRFPMYGATTNGLAPAKDPVGKNPQRYKLLKPGTVFYNPMRIMIGSVAVVEDDIPAGITSPDYVAVTAKAGTLDWRWFYYWMRSPYGRLMIQATSRGAVRERILFNRLKVAEIDIPEWQTQLETSSKLFKTNKLIEKLEDLIPKFSTLSNQLLLRAFSGGLA